MPAHLPPAARRPPSILPLAVLLLAGCTAAAADKAPDPGSAASAPRAAAQTSEPAPQRRGAAAPAASRASEPAPVPRVTLGNDRSTWNPTRSAYGWPDRFGGEAPGAPFRPRL
jgi:hypothetical protein